MGVFDWEDWQEEAEEFLSEFEDIGREFRGGVDKPAAIKGIAEAMAEAHKASYESFIEWQTDKWHDDYHQEDAREGRAYAAEDALISLTYNPKYGTEAEYDAAMAAEEAERKARREANERAEQHLRSTLPGLFLDAMEPGKVYRFSSPEFPEVAEREIKAAGYSGSLGAKGFTSQTLEALISTGRITKSGDKPRALVKAAG